ncbi:hypothetical protein HPB47_022224 [Ixodes persulcatus]|uniref:Uncharacterized protein n=1 Tax=Ixodes persulcatus TaxID=34615 RepID=A0AC60QAP1_IXOPE|nr:hypothetical protein HPB47_022224 [Ixodes persulcatus]
MVKFVPQANRIVLAVWVIACLILNNLFNGEVKANLLVKSDTARINSAEDVLRDPKILPITMKNSPITTALQYRAHVCYRSLVLVLSMDSVRKLYDRMAAMGGEIPVPEIYTAKTMELVQQRKAIIVTDMMTGRVQSSLFCPVLNGFFYVGTQILTSLRSVWYFRMKSILPSPGKSTREQFVTEATNIERALQARASHYQRLPGVVASASSSCYLGSTTSDLREIIRDVVREELRKLLPAAERPASLSVAEIVRDEVQRALQPETPVDVPAPEQPTLTYAAMARRPPQAPRQATAPPRREPLQRRSTPNDAKDGSTSDQSDPRREKPTCGERPTDARLVTIAGKPTMSTAVARTDSWGYAASTPTTRAHATVSDHARSTTTYDVHPLGCLRLDVCPVRLHLDVLQHHLSIGPDERACLPCPAGKTECRNTGRHEVVFPTDGQYGDIAPDGSIHGSLMMINKELADVAIGPFNLEYIQWKVFPTATQLTYDNFQLISGMKDPFVSDSGAFINIFDRQLLTVAGFSTKHASLKNDVVPSLFAYRPPAALARSAGRSSLVLLIASGSSPDAASEWRPRGRQSWILFLISLTSLIVLSTAFYRIAGRQRKTSLFYDTSKYLYAYIEVLFFEATKVQFVPQANRILLAVWLIACLILINLFNGEVKANLLVKSDTERINTAEDVLRHPNLLPLTMKNSPLTTALQPVQLGFAPFGSCCLLAAAVQRRPWTTAARDASGSPAHDSTPAGRRPNQRSAVFVRRRGRQPVRDCPLFIHGTRAAVGQLADQGPAVPVRPVTSPKAHDHFLQGHYAWPSSGRPWDVAKWGRVPDARAKPYSLVGGFPSSFSGKGIVSNEVARLVTQAVNWAIQVNERYFSQTSCEGFVLDLQQISSSESVRRLWDRMDAMGGAIPVPEVFTAKSLQMVQQRKAVIASDMMTGRVQSSLFCPLLEGFFYVGTQSITNLRSVWYYRKRIDPDLVKAINKRILWLFESAVPFMRNEDLFPKGSTCFLDTSKQDRSGSFQPLTAQDMRAVFMLSGYLIAMACVFLLVELIVHGLSHCAGYPARGRRV